jgi:hypothetical protein
MVVGLLGVKIRGINCILKAKMTKYERQYTSCIMDAFRLLPGKLPNGGLHALVEEE